MPAVKLIHTKDDPVRLSFPDLFEPTQYQGKGPFRYNAAFIVKPGGENDKRIQAAILAAATETFEKRAATMLEGFKGNTNRMCYTKGDLKEYEGYAGNLVLSGHRGQKQGKPGVFDCTRAGPDGKPLPLTADSGKPYAGCYVNASVDIYAQSGENQGIRCGLVGVWFAADGDAFSGARTAAPSEFDVVESGANAESLV